MIVEYCGDDFADKYYGWLRGYMIGLLIESEMVDSVGLSINVELLEFYADGYDHGQAERYPRSHLKVTHFKSEPFSHEASWMRGFILGSMWTPDSMFDKPFNCIGCLNAMIVGLGEGVEAVNTEFEAQGNRWQ